MKIALIILVAYAAYKVAKSGTTAASTPATSSTGQPVTGAAAFVAKVKSFLKEVF
ncbi:MAG: hypothetical protein WBR15_02725 [Gammaproteobacteria bacterium]